MVTQRATVHDKRRGQLCHGVSAEDVLNNVATTSSTQISLAISTNPPGGTLTCGASSVTPTSGVATFSCSLNKDRVRLRTDGVWRWFYRSHQCHCDHTWSSRQVRHHLLGGIGRGVVESHPGPITVQQRDAGGNPTTRAETVSLTSNSTGTARFSKTSGGSVVTSVAISAGSSSTTFYYADTKAATPTITASGLVTNATQTETITAAAAAGYVFSSSAVSGAASSSPTLGPITVQEQDAFGNVTTTAETVNLASNSTGTPGSQGPQAARSSPRSRFRPARRRPPSTTPTPRQQRQPSRRRALRPMPLRSSPSRRDPSASSVSARRRCLEWRRRVPPWARPCKSKTASVNPTNTAAETVTLTSNTAKAAKFSSTSGGGRNRRLDWSRQTLRRRPSTTATPRRERRPSRFRVPYVDVHPGRDHHRRSGGRVHLYWRHGRRDLTNGYVLGHLGQFVL